jgi:hypothetical protein
MKKKEKHRRVGEDVTAGSQDTPLASSTSAMSVYLNLRVRFSQLPLSSLFVFAFHENRNATLFFIFVFSLFAFARQATPCLLPSPSSFRSQLCSSFV